MKENKSIYQRLIAFQAELPAITKEANNPFFKSKYATLEAIQQSIQPLLAKHGLGYMFTTVDGGLNCTVFDTDDNTIDFVYPANLQGKPQDIGSAISYAKRYALSAVLGLIVGGEDDDGNKANETQEVKATQKKADTPFDNVTTEQANEIIKLLQGSEAQKKAGYAYYKKIGSNTKIDGGDYDRIKVAIEEAYNK